MIILIIVFFLVILGLGWNTFFEGLKKGADKIGITSMIENATGEATNEQVYDMTLPVVQKMIESFEITI
ncbi:MAG: hypothetical protein ACR2IS_09110 [Nitrososphaeraceae archaeon]